MRLIYQLFLYFLVLVALQACTESNQETVTPAAQSQENLSDIVMEVTAQNAIELNDEQIENIVRRSYQYVAMYNVISHGALNKKNPQYTDGWNRMFVATTLADHNMKSIPRPNNDSLYLPVSLDQRDDAVVVKFPAFDSSFVVLETSSYDHYIDIPLSTTYGDFRKPTTMLFYTARTKGYNGEPIKGIDKTLKMSGDFAAAFLRVMPHANEPERMKRIIAEMQSLEVMTLSEFLGKPEKPVSNVEFPAYANPQTVFKNNFQQVMQFVVNHTTFDPGDQMDNKVLAALKPIGVEPGKTFDPSSLPEIDGAQLAKVAASIAQESLQVWNTPEGNPHVNDVFLPKGQMNLEAMVVQSAVGPIGLPAHQAEYPGIGTADASPMMSNQRYIVRMTKNQLPPATAFWSVTLYDAVNGFFIPNDTRKYSVGENTGMKLDASGGIEIHIAPTQPEGVPMQNWLPAGDKVQRLDMIMRIYGPDVEIMKKWTVPKAELVE